MKRSYAAGIFVIGIFTFIALGVFFLVKKPQNVSTENSQKLRVAATIYPLYDIARQVAGDRADVILIVPPGASDENFQVSPKDVGRISGSRAIFSIGHGLDAWALDIANTIPDSEVITVDKNIILRTSAANGKGPADPHYWLDFGNARKIADTIAASLSEYDNGNAATYEENAEKLNNDLTAEEVRLSQKLEPYKGASLVVFHDAWYYFADALGLSVAGVFKLSAADEPSPRHLAILKNIIQEKNITTLFIEPQISSAAIEGFVEENNLTTAELDPVGGIPGRLTYNELMRYNIEEIVKALSKKNENTQRN